MLTTNRKGFTLLELIVVIVVAGILAGIAIPTFNQVKSKANQESARQEAYAFAKEVTALASFTEADDASLFTDEAAADLNGGGSYSPSTLPYGTGTFYASNGLGVNIDFPLGEDRAVLSA